MSAIEEDPSLELEGETEIGNAIENNTPLDSTMMSEENVSCNLLKSFYYNIFQ